MKHLFAIAMLSMAIDLPGIPDIQAQITPVNYPTPLPAGRSVTGVVTNIDPVNHMLQLRDAIGMLQTVHVDENVQLVEKGNVVSFSNVRLGETVTATAVSNR